ncbi:tubulin/FtsZ family protein [Salinirubellus salinus]|jgi:cell division GTPase FtsZ|uniref:Tubulin-like protein CetZ n=1 Tax=Salinirubellus salinus TaxID=1364945 RepID=A0A9E7QZY7_9EURY|nr:tubulin/FtsZ family protein [Salinirubellus salinus]UWM53017.1 tubulin/FtsZ family protein [Salinirubellus salinus]
MKLGVIGYGNAGGKIADRLLQFEEQTHRNLTRAVIAINSAKVDLERLEHIPRENRFLVGQTDERVKGHGVGGDPDLGAEITRQDQYEIDRALDRVPVYDIGGFLIIAGLGGGTGSGGAPELAEHIRETYEEPVYGLGILPAEEEGGRAALNAARSLQAFTQATDNLVLFDNHAWRGSEDSVVGGFDRTNTEIVKRVVTLLSAGEIDGSRISENAMDSGDIRRTMATGGVSTIAYAETALGTEERDAGLLGRFREQNSRATANGADAGTRVSGLIRQAVQSRLTCPAAVDSAERSLIVVSGPPEAFSRKGLEKGRQWLERETDSAEVLAGDDPRDGARTLSAVVLLSNVTDVPRVKQLQQQAIMAQRSIKERETTRADEIQALITDDGNELEPL